jgi:transcriptional repressor NrdR
MRCPYCGSNEDKVVDSRDSREGRAIRRRRECLKCGKRYTTYEMVEEISLMVVKKDGRREPFDRQKILTGIRRACQKRPIGLEQMEAIVDEIEKNLQGSFEREVKTTEIGNLVMERLKALDKVAYVRFASVYREFKDTTDFMKVL